MADRQQSQFVSEHLLFEAFRNRDTRRAHWADGLLHVVPHEQVQNVALHHQHAQYHQVLFWMENLFPQAARWLGVRELARLLLDFLENSPCHSENPFEHANRLVDKISAKRSHLHAAQLETLLRGGMACWKIKSASWRSDLAVVPRERKFALTTLIEHNLAAFVEPAGDWSAFDLWQSAQTGKAVENLGEPDVLAVFRKDEFSLEFERWSPQQLKLLLEDQRE